jgi:hypothetical protein
VARDNQTDGVLNVTIDNLKLLDLSSHGVDNAKLGIVFFVVISPFIIEVRCKWVLLLLQE